MIEMTIRDRGKFKWQPASFLPLAFEVQREMSRFNNVSPVIGVFYMENYLNSRIKFIGRRCQLRNRKKSKRTLWDEELDNEESLIDKLYNANVNNLTPYFDPYFSQNEYKGNKNKCNSCGNEYENNETEISKSNLYCRVCGQGL